MASYNRSFPNYDWLLEGSVINKDGSEVPLSNYFVILDPWDPLEKKVPMGATSLMGKYQTAPYGKNNKQHFIDNFENRRVLLMPLDLAVDTNRDEVITFGADDKTSEGKPYRFWVNNDDDSNFGDSQKEVTPVEQENGSNTIIDSERDLEDLSRLWIKFGALHDQIRNGEIQIGLKFEAISGDPSIKVYNTVDGENGSLSYLTDEQVAEIQVNTSHRVHQGHVTTGEPTILSSGLVFDQLTTDEPITYLLFEGVSEGKGKLQVVLMKDGEELGTAGELYVELLDIKKMYERGIATPDNIPDPQDVTGTSLPVPTVGYAQHDLGHAFQPSWDEEGKNYVVFVHGWKMFEHEAIGFAETMYKRLWHQGYKGRFAFFRWPTYAHEGFGIINFDIANGIAAFLAKFNESEYRAWRYGESLKQYVESLPSDYTMNMAAHSMGNITAGSALIRGLSVNNYALLQAAVPASCYDTDTSLFQAEAEVTVNMDGIPLPFTYWENESPDDDPDSFTQGLSYRGRLGNVTGNLINFYLEDDVATKDAWEANNDTTKPAHLITGYSYDRSLLSGQKIQLDFLLSVGRFVTDPYEVMPMANQSKTKTVGADSRTNGSIDSKVNLNQAGIALQDEHSGEFNRTIHQLNEFYDELIDQLDL